MPARASRACALMRCSMGATDHKIAFGPNPETFGIGRRLTRALRSRVNRLCRFFACFFLRHFPFGAGAEPSWLLCQHPIWNIVLRLSACAQNPLMKRARCFRRGARTPEASTNLWDWSSPGKSGKRREVSSAVSTSAHNSCCPLSALSHSCGSFRCSGLRYDCYQQYTTSRNHDGYQPLNRNHAIPGREAGSICRRVARAFGSMRDIPRGPRVLLLDTGRRRCPAPVESVPGRA